jgi:hypothetical protein
MKNSPTAPTRSPYTDPVTIRSYARRVGSMPVHSDPKVRHLQLREIAAMVHRGELVHTPSHGLAGPATILRAVPGRDIGIRLA